MNINQPVLETVKLTALKPWGKNPRKDHAVPQIMRSLEAFGYMAPIIVQKGTYRIIAGHGRYKAMKQMGVEEVPVIVADVDDDRADLYTLTDNKLTEISGWDFAGMADLLLEFDQKNLDVSLTGFTQEELEEIANWTQEAVVTTEGELPQALQLEPPKEYALIICENDEEWERLKVALNLTPVRRGGYKAGSVFDAVGTQRVVKASDFLARIEVPNAGSNTQ